MCKVYKPGYLYCRLLLLILVPMFRAQEEEHLDIIFITKDYNFS